MKRITIILICLIMLLNNFSVYAADESSQEKDMPIVVSLGDSYSAGESVQPYYGQHSSDKHTCEDWIAHRSSCAWPGLLQYNGKRLNTVRAENPSVLEGLTIDYDSCKDDGSWYFTAVSGAVTRDIISMQYIDEDGETKTSYGQVKKVQESVFHKLKEYKLNLQIDTVKAVQSKAEQMKKNIDYITMTIGGNDVGFVDIIKKSIMTAQDPSSTPVVKAVSDISGPIASNVTVPIVSNMIDMSHLKNKLVEVTESFWDNDPDSYSKRLEKTYKEILKAAPAATLVIAGYPKLLHINKDGSGNGGFFSYKESLLINSAVVTLNEYLNTLVKNLETDRIIFVDVVSAFEGHEAYAEEPFINGIDYGFDENINFTGVNFAINSASFHPNEKGVYKYASAVQEALAKIDSGFAETYYNTDSQLEVYDFNGELYDNYTVEVSGKEYKNIIGNFDFGGLFKQDYHKTFASIDNQPLPINLPKGNYTLTIVDNFDTNKKISIPIKIRGGSENKDLVVATNFGFDYTIGTSSEMTVYDMNDQIYDNYSVEISGKVDSENNNSETFKDTITSTSKDPLKLYLDAGKYTFLLKDEMDSSKTKSVTVRVKSLGLSSFGVDTVFGEKAGKFDKDNIPKSAVEYNGHYYYIFTDDISWYDAEEYCRSQGGYLATITSQSEQNFVQQYMEKTKKSLEIKDNDGNKTTWEEELWIGANDTQLEGEWHWSNGEKFDYKNWASGQPDDSGGQDYGAMLSFLAQGTGYRIDKGQWDDTSSYRNPFICEWGEYTPESAEKKLQKMPNRQTSNERDIVLVLDVSSSMSGTPMVETKKASTNFIQTILKEDASIGIVTYDSSASMQSDFSMDKDHLTSVVDGIHSGGSTNIDAGLSTAYEMLKNSNAEKQIIVLMSDGEPNNGRQGDALISFADEIKNYGIYIYTLGFFGSMGNSKSSAQILMEEIASDGCHYEVDDADSLVFFFDDIADQIKGQKYVYVRIACPVDVKVSYNGETLSSTEKDFNGRTTFGSLTLEDIEDSDDKIKTLRLKEGVEYDIKIEGTGRGKMDYTIGYMDDSGEYSDLRKFRSIPITRSTVIDTSTEKSNKTVLNVDEDGDGKYDSKYQAGENEYGEIVDYTYVVYIVLGIVGVIVVLAAVIIIRKKLKNRKAD